jgi:hypothetical protein
MSILLFLLYPVAIQVERGGAWNLLLPVTLLALLIDVLANYTELALIFGWPRSGEWTFSQRLRRLSWRADWRGDLARWCIDYTDRFDPDGRHVL